MNCLGILNQKQKLLLQLLDTTESPCQKKDMILWQTLMSKEDKTLVLEMSLILRLAASLDQRPENVISSITIKLKKYPFN